MQRSREEQQPLFTILKGGHRFTPEDAGVGDVVLAAGTISNLAEDIAAAPAYGAVEVLDVRGKYVVPGFVDQHVHILGGGGEGGYTTRTPEVMLSQLTEAGITTVVGCLGTDGTTRHVSSLLAKARALEEEGVTTYIYTGAYEVPAPTITENVRNDLILIDKVIGCGEVAIADHRSAQPGKEDLKKLAAQCRVGGLLSGKAGVLHLHVGGSRQGLKHLFEILDEGEIPVSQFTPTHINRSQAVLEEGIVFARRGGMIDFTTSAKPAAVDGSRLKAARAVRFCLEKGVGIGSMTLSSDGNGSLPLFNEHGQTVGLAVGEPVSLHREFRDMVVSENLGLEASLRVVTVNPARSLRLFPSKGVLRVGADADILILNEELEIEYVFARGRCLVRQGRAVVKGTFERS
ncbi:beta-aspartyl-peptidase [Acididesulfobacillus acetoxydans]|uniref:Isoaspartyl dipeptidase n=1 Tax=Acididesulfobacillus acetoxydans TaxID=1561005 RepID=A0A8S0WFH6_9FIRM|nr:beta-aspartyl-peptidase [Acididesulfobacillus acetoxydans]CAA7601052.1 beta-aspartyl-peptidase [Acididesulfobacillus acetoxydans]CEJ06926.1 Isoaspartyl dipeptidase [Acididesulfobacillus acetoxydans]